MTKQSEYLELARTFEQAAKKAADPGARIQLQTIADTYLTLAKSAGTLQRSAAMIERLPHGKR